MLVFTLRRLNLFVFTLFLLTVLSFSLSFMFPGDPLVNISGEVNPTPTRLAELAEIYSKDQGLISQYFTYIGNIFSGEFGVSMVTDLSLLDTILSLLPATIELSLVALFIAMVFGIPLGFIAAIKHRKNSDNVILSIAMVGYSLPVFWVGLMAIQLFSIELGWFPSAGQISPVYEIESRYGILIIDILLSESTYKWQAFSDATLHLILPASVVALAPATIFVRLARTAMLEVLETPYIRAAKAKGLSFAQVVYSHAIRNALIMIVRHIGLQFANLITIAMITEVIFSWPGIGRWLIESIYQRDYTAIQVGLLVLSSFIFVVHILSDFLYAALNPLARGKKYGS
ncbi:ABC transporter permease [Thalassotalea sp. LPB0316]|uniref:ABC transporter permease n=1 Tax=Thalassotalea sp. LPB0316 TaxID=2769490 RepID=UPI00186806A3|nr:ABC transporter permease [Thalassotalea sp. LPB0316]QOL27136.1 ABC transporter permease [Thalassotalea sp. LPB0316]